VKRTNPEKTPSYVVVCTVHVYRESGTVVDVATRYGLDGPGIESRWEGGDFSYPFTPALGTTQPPIQWVSGSLG
jgi:hypothetical protein